MIKPVKVTFKQDERWLSEFINDRSSPTGYLKDLAIADYHKNNTLKKTEDKMLHNTVSSNLFDIVD